MCAERTVVAVVVVVVVAVVAVVAVVIVVVVLLFIFWLLLLANARWQTTTMATIQRQWQRFFVRF